jgi:hypothetical protein
MSLFTAARMNLFAAAAALQLLLAQLNGTARGGGEVFAAKRAGTLTPLFTRVSPATQIRVLRQPPPVRVVVVNNPHVVPLRVSTRHAGRSVSAPPAASTCEHERHRNGSMPHMVSSVVPHRLAVLFIVLFMVLADGPRTTRAEADYFKALLPSGRRQTHGRHCDDRHEHP